MKTQSTNKPTLGILMCGHSPEKMVETYGPYDQLFVKLLGHDNFEYKIFVVVDGVFPSSINDADAWLITGSKHGAYEPHAWIPPLEDFIRDAFAAKMPMVGICFGHQILAQALGGRVEKFDGGWIVGTQEYQVEQEIGLNQATLNAWHQDQVVELPENARALASGPNCQYAAIAYGDHAVSMQPHPEFENEYVKSLMTERGWVLPAEIYEKATASLDQNLDNKHIADWLQGILLQQAQ